MDTIEEFHCVIKMMQYTGSCHVGESTVTSVSRDLSESVILDELLP